MQPRTAMLVALWLSFSVGTFAADFQVEFVNKPAAIRFNAFYGKHELALELKLTEVGPSDPQNKRLVTGLAVTADSGIKNKDFGATVLGHVSKDGTGGQLLFLCSSFRRCSQIKQQIDANPSYIRQAVEIAPFGLQGGLPVQFGSVRPSGQPAFSEVVFQQHLDNSMSFAQDWDSYAKGFGDPRGNYWMGLEQLSTLTKDRSCKLIYEATTFNGTVLRATFKDFQVRGADENYKLRVGKAEQGNQLWDMELENNMEFSTFDKDNDKNSSLSCSKTFNNVGFWYNGVTQDKCYYHNPNNPIVPEDKLASADCRKFCISWDLDSAGKSVKVCLKRTKLSFRCS